MSEKYTIEKNVPLRKPLDPFPLDDLKVGESFVVELRDKRDRYTAGQRLHRYRKANPPKQFRQETRDRQMRIWRVEDAE